MFGTEQPRIDKTPQPWALVTLWILCALSLAGCDQDNNGELPPEPSGEEPVAEPGVMDFRCARDIDCARAGFLCLEGTCTQALCRPGEITCRNRERVLCNEAGLGYSSVEQCGPEQGCRQGQCMDLLCEPNQVRCEGNTRRICNEAGTGEEFRPCLGQQICFEGMCMDALCSDSETTCLDDLTLGRCDNGGFRGEPCGSNARCFEKLCIPFHALQLGPDNPEASLVVQQERPEESSVALWLTLEDLPNVPVDLFSWTDAETAQDGLTVRYLPGIQELSVTSIFGEVRFPLTPAQGLAFHLQIGWTSTEVTHYFNGFLIATEPLDIPSGGDTLTVGQLSQTGTAWPGKLGYLWIGAQPGATEFVPRCDGAHAAGPLLFYALDEGDGQEVSATSGAGPMLRIEGASWTGGFMGQFARDADDDGWGFEPEAVLSCGPINDDDVLRLGDCNDGNNIIYPTSPEPEDLIDNDCDNEIDEA